MSRAGGSSSRHGSRRIFARRAEPTPTEFDPSQIFLKGKGAVVINLNTYKEKLLQLRPFADIPIQKLGPAEKEQFQEVYEIGSINNKAAAAEIERVTLEVFDNLNQFVPDSVGAYFRSCYVHSDVPGLPSCSPACVGGFKPTDPNYMPCPDRIITYRGSRIFEVHNPDLKNPLRTVIYMELPFFSAFSESEVAQLRQIGVNHVQVYNKINTDYINLYDCQLDELKMIPDDFVSSGSSSSSSDDSNTAWWIVLAIVAFFLILLFLFVLIGWNNWSSSA